MDREEQPAGSQPGLKHEQNRITEGQPGRLKLPDLGELRAKQEALKETKSKEQQEKERAEREAAEKAERIEQGLNKHWQLQRQLRQAEAEVAQLEQRGVGDRHVNKEARQTRLQEIQSEQVTLQSTETELHEYINGVQELVTDEDHVSPEVTQALQTAQTELRTIQSNLKELNKSLEALQTELSDSETLERYAQLVDQINQQSTELSQLEADPELLVEIQKQEKRIEDHYKETANRILQGSGGRQNWAARQGWLNRHLKEVVAADGRVAAAEDRDTYERQVSSALGAVAEGSILAAERDGHRELTDRVRARGVNERARLVIEGYMATSITRSGQPLAPAAFIGAIGDLEALMLRAMERDAAERQMEATLVAQGHEANSFSVARTLRETTRPYNEQPRDLKAEQKARNEVARRHLDSINYMIAQQTALAGLPNNQFALVDTQDLPSRLSHFGLSVDRKTGMIFDSNIKAGHLHEKQKEQFAQQVREAASEVVKQLEQQAGGLREQIQRLEASVGANELVIAEYNRIKAEHREYFKSGKGFVSDIDLNMQLGVIGDCQRTIARLERDLSELGIFGAMKRGGINKQIIEARSVMRQAEAKLDQLKTMKELREMAERPLPRGVSEGSLYNDKSKLSNLQEQLRSMDHLIREKTKLING